MLKRISITGPESTGKTWLAKRLAEHYNTVWVHEYAVDYLDKNGSDYKLNDIVEICKGQVEKENNLSNVASGLLFSDTDILVTKIWSKVVFGEVPALIEQRLIEHKYDLYLLCYPDLEWEYAPFRENPNNRDYLFELYESELKKLDFDFRIVSGIGDERLKNAVNFVDELFPLQASTP